MHISQFFQLISNSSISLILSFMVINYHQYLMNLVMILSHQVHHWYLSMIIPNLPNYSDYLQDSTSIKLVLIYTLLIAGYLGLSVQLNATLDLIFLFNIPTILIYRLLAYIYSRTIKIINFLYKIVTTDE
jgi:hypothetical protein